MQAGENLYRIGLQYGVPWPEIAAANGITDPTQLGAGQELIIPAPAPISPVEPEPTEQAIENDEMPGAEEPVSSGDIEHQVQAGETIFSVAFQYNVPWTRLVDVNELSSPYTLQAGQILLIPGGS